MRKNGLFRLILILTIGIMIGWSSYYYAQDARKPGPTHAAAPSQAIQSTAPLTSINAAKQMSQAFVEVSRKVTPSIVMIMNEERFKNAMGSDDSPPFFDDDFFRRFFDFTPEQREQVQKTLGSGVIVSSEGYIITNNHVVDNSTKLQVTLPDGSRVAGKIIGTDPKTDLALIKVDAKDLQPIHFGNYQDTQVGEWVLAIGSPFGEALQRTVTAGIISAKSRSNVGIADYEDFLQTDAAINPGNSGGALVDLDGNLIGINTAIVSSNGSNAGIGFAIPVNLVQSVFQQLKQNGHVIRGYLGVTIQDLTPEMKKSLHLQNVQGAVVSEVQKDTPAERAGIKPYDVITSVNGKPVHDNTELRNVIFGMRPGTRATLGVVRDGKERSVDVSVGEMKNDESSSKEPSGREEKWGMQLQNLTPQIARELHTQATSGVVITRITPGSAAEDAGLQEGDVIFEVNRHEVRSVSEFFELAGKEKDSILLAVDRQGNSFFVTLQIQ